MFNDGIASAASSMTSIGDAALLQSDTFACDSLVESAHTSMTEAPGTTAAAKKDALLKAFGENVTTEELLRLIMRQRQRQKVSETGGGKQAVGMPFLSTGAVKPGRRRQSIVSVNAGQQAHELERMPSLPAPRNPLAPALPTFHPPRSPPTDPTSPTASDPMSASMFSSRSTLPGHPTPSIRVQQPKVTFVQALPPTQPRNSVASDEQPCQPSTLEGLERVGSDRWFRQRSSSVKSGDADGASSSQLALSSTIMRARHSIWDQPKTPIRTKEQEVIDEHKVFSERIQFYVGVVLTVLLLYTMIEVLAATCFELLSPIWHVVFDMVVVDMGLLACLVVTWSHHAVQRLEAHGEVTAVSVRMQVHDTVKQMGFWLDVVGLLPLQLVGLAPGVPKCMAFLGQCGVVLPYWRLNRLLLCRFMFTRAADQTDNPIAQAMINDWNWNPKAVRLMVLAVQLVSTCHVLCCLTSLVSFLADDFTFFGHKGNYREADRFLQFTLAYDFTMKKIFGFDAGDEWPDSTSIAAWYLVMVFFGVFCYSVFLSLVFEFLNLPTSESEKQTKLQTVIDALNYLKLDGSLHDEILAYYKHMLVSHETDLASSDDYLGDLPPELQDAVSIFLGSEIVKRVPLFAPEVDNAQLLLMIQESLVPTVFPPKAILFHRGDEGDAMYFVTRGCVAVLSPDESDVVVRLPSGSYFGEIALLMSGSRTATVQSLEFTNCLVLHKDDFDTIINAFPDVHARIEDLARRRVRETLDDERRRRVITTFLHASSHGMRRYCFARWEALAREARLQKARKEESSQLLPMVSPRAAGGSSPHAEPFSVVPLTPKGEEVGMVVEEWN